MSIISEEESLRGEYQKHFLCSDGSYVAVSYGYPVHYEDENGIWQEVDNTLIQTTINGITTYSNKDGLFNIEFSANKEKLVTLENDGYRVLHCKDGSTANNTPVQTYAYEEPGNNSQKWTLTSVLSSLSLNVAAIQQSASNACGAASGRMIVDYLGGTSLTETQFLNSALNGDTDHATPYLYQYRNQINRCLSSTNKSYTYTNINNYTQSQYLNLLYSNLANGYPIQALIATTDSSDSTFNYSDEFGYSSIGHYIVITGIEINGTNDITIIYNDPHYIFTNTVYSSSNTSGGKRRKASLSDMYTCNIHREYVIHGDY